MNSFMRFLLIAGISGACAFGQGQTGTSTVTRDFVFPPVGLGSTETAQVNLVNIAPASTASTATAPSCTGTVTFASATGATIGQANPFTAASGQIASVSLPFSSAGISGTHGVILVSVQQTTTIPSAARCSLVFSLDIFDTATGETHVFVGNASSNATPLMIPASPPLR
jgi:hypothetical protein